MAKCDLCTSSTSRDVFLQLSIETKVPQQPGTKRLKAVLFPSLTKKLGGMTWLRATKRPSGLRERTLEELEDGSQKGPWLLTWALSTWPFTMSRKTLGFAAAMARERRSRPTPGRTRGC